MGAAFPAKKVFSVRVGTGHARVGKKAGRRTGGSRGHAARSIAKYEGKKSIEKKKPKITNQYHRAGNRQNEGDLKEKVKKIRPMVATRTAIKN